MKSKTTYPILLGCLLAAGALVPDAGAQAAPKHRYSFTDGGADSNTVTDSVGGANGTLIRNLDSAVGVSTFADGQLALGNVDGMSSNASPIAGDYVHLPNGMFSDLVGAGGVTAFTLEGWYTWQGTGDWQRFYDVGRSLGGEDISDRADLQPNFFIAVKAGGVAGSRAAWTGRGIGEDGISSQNAADSATGVPHHVAFVWDESNTSARYYVDGTLVGENTATAMTVQNDFAGDDVNNWLGRSNWPDNLFVGSFDEFRVYDEALSAPEVLDNLGNGPDALDGSGRGTLSEFTAAIDRPVLIPTATASITSSATYPDLGGTFDVSGFSSGDGISYSSDNTSAATVGESGLVTAVGLGDANITINFDGGSAMVAVSVVSAESIMSTAGSTIIVGETTSVSTVASFADVTGFPITNFEGMTYSSSNPTIASVDEAGVVTGVNAGDVTVTVEYAGLSSTVDVAVEIPPFPVAVLQHRYSFSDAVGSGTVADSVGTAHGEARNITFTGAGTANLDNADNATTMNYAHVALPSGIISVLDNVTFETWATYSGLGGPWQRIFDFGNTGLGKEPGYLPEDPGYNGQDTSYIFYTPRSGGNIADNAANGGRVAYQQDLDDRDAGEAGENPNITVPAGQGPTAGEEFHLAFIYNYSQRIASIWINGALVGQQAIPSDRPLSGIEDENVWLGRSQWKTDAMLDGNFNEFRIYEGALSPFQVVINNAVGPDTQLDDPGEVQSLTFEILGDAPVAGGAPLGFSLIADFEAVQDIELADAQIATLTSSDESVVRSFNGQLLPVAAGTVTITASLEGQEVTAQVTVGANPTTPVLDHRFSFNGDLVDSVGGLDTGTLQGGAAFENGGVTLPGGATDAGFIDLPDFMFSNYYFDQTELVALTFEIYGNWAGGDNWQRMLDFGNQAGDPLAGVSFLYISPSDGGGVLHANFTTTGVPAINITGPGLAPGEDFYVALVFDPVSRVLRLYRNGVLAAVQPFPAAYNFAVDFNHLVVNDENEWMGRSQFASDPAFAGSITEYRVWNGALLDSDVALHNACGPDELDCEIIGPTDPVPLSAGLTAEGVVISWPSEGAGLQLQVSGTIKPADWQDVATPPVTVGDTTSVTITDLAGEGYFRLINQ